MTLFVARPYQPAITNFVVNNLRCNVYCRMGAGKTAAILEAVATLLLFGEVRRVLIIAPKRVAQYTWLDEVKQFFESFGHMTIAAAVGTPAQRLAAVKKNTQILTVNYESVEWLISGYGDRWPFDMVVADEVNALKSHRVGQRVSSKGTEYYQGQGSVRAAAIAKIAHKYVRRWVGATGSPAANGLVDLYGICWFVDGGKSLGMSFDAFRSRWFRSFQTDAGYTQYEPLENAKEEIERAIKPYSITIDPRPFLNTRALVEHHVMIKLPPKARLAYNEMEKQLFTELRAGIVVEAFNAGGSLNKSLQLASGFGIHDTESGAYEITHTEKIEALRSIVHEMMGENLLVRYQFKAERDQILKAFPKFRSLETDKDAIRNFQQGKLIGLVAHAKSVGHGLGLHQHCRTLIDYSSNHNLGDDEQIIERVGPTRQAQAGRDVDSLRYRVIAEDTIEQTSVLPRLETKCSTQDSLLAAMQRSM